MQTQKNQLTQGSQGGLQDISSPSSDTPSNNSNTKDYDQTHNPQFFSSWPSKPVQGSDPFSFIKSSDECQLVVRQSSIASFQNLSIGDCTSVCDSQYSHYNPSINEPFVSTDADSDEKEMHQFLDSAGIFQVNCKQQIDQEKKSAYSVSQTKRLSFVQKRTSPSFMERRARLMSLKDSSKGGKSDGAQSQNVMVPAMNIKGLPSFSAEMFKQGNACSSLPKSVEEEPNSGDSHNRKLSQFSKPDSTKLADQDNLEVETEAQNKNQSTGTPSTKQKFGWAVLRDDENASDKGPNCDPQLLISNPSQRMAMRHQSLTPPAVKIEMCAPGSDNQTHKQSSPNQTSPQGMQSLLLTKEDHSSLSGFSIRPQPMTTLLDINAQDCDEFVRKTSAGPSFFPRQHFFDSHNLGITCPAFSTSNASEEQPCSGASFSAKAKVVHSNSISNHIYESPDNQTPTLPAHAKDCSKFDRPLIDLDEELLGSSSPSQDSAQVSLRMSSAKQAPTNEKITQPVSQFLSPDNCKDDQGAIDQSEQAMGLTNYKLDPASAISTKDTPDTPFFKADSTDCFNQINSGNIFRSSPTRNDSTKIPAEWSSAQEK